MLNAIFLNFSAQILVPYLLVRLLFPVIILYYISLYQIICYIISYYTISYNIILYLIILYYIILYYISLYYIMLYYIISYYVISNCIILYYINHYNSKELGHDRFLPSKAHDILLPSGTNQPSTRSILSSATSETLIYRTLHPSFLVRMGSLAKHFAKYLFASITLMLKSFNKCCNGYVMSIVDFRNSTVVVGSLRSHHLILGA